MAIKISKSGVDGLSSNLVFSYDVKNPKSWIGKPTTNLVPNPDASWNGSGFTFGYSPYDATSPAATFTYVPGLPNPAGASGVMRYQINNSGYKYWSIYAPVSSSGIHTFSYYARIVAGNGRSTLGNSQLWRDTDVDRSVTGDWNPFHTSQWVRRSTTGTVSSSLNYFPIHYATSGSGYIVEFCGFQLESGSYASPWVRGTRTNTQALLDLTGKNIITANSLSYNSNNTFYFNGSSDYLSTSQLVGPGASKYTVSVWVKRARTAATGSYENIISQWTNANISNSFYAGFSPGNAMRFSDNWNGITVAGSDQVGTWQHFAFVNTGNNAYIYRNGVLAATKGSPLTYTGVGPAVFGRQGEYTNTLEYFYGDIDNVEVFNVDLSAAQIANNFEALRGRYGI